MMSGAGGARDQKDASAALSARQYAEWGLVIQTNRMRAAHVANGLVQLLRLLPSDSAQPSEGLDPAEYVRGVKMTLRPRLSEAARALCVYRSKRGPVSLFPPSAREEKFVPIGREHLQRSVEAAEHAFTPAAHRALADVLSADGVVFAQGGSDPTTTGLDFAGYTDTHTLKGMHAATYLGLLASTSRGRTALSALHKVARGTDDPHSRLVSLLGLSDERPWPARLEPAQLEGAFPLPSGPRWRAAADVAGRLASHLLERHARGVTKAETLMALVDLALLQLALLLLRWERGHDQPDTRLLLALSTRERSESVRHALARAQESLHLARASLEHQARQPAPLTREGDNVRYSPSAHATNLLAAGGWIGPTDRRRSGMQFLSPGSRQLVTLVHAIVPPTEGWSWSRFAREVEQTLGLALGGADDRTTEQALRLGGAAEALREAARVNQEHALQLGQARRESDNVVIVDGGEQ